jgi:hypothetical protein
MFVSTTRLRLRHSWYLLPFGLHAFRIQRQLRGSGGFLVGGFAVEPWLVFWTVSIWTDASAMRGFRNASAHLAALPRLSRWCDEASYGHWEQGDTVLPDAQGMFARMRDEGVLSTVRWPGRRHLAGMSVGDGPPRMVGGRVLPSSATGK